MKRFVIHIPGSSRYDHLKDMMDKHYGNDWEIFQAVVNDHRPTLGISESFKKVISENINEEMIHVLEDDVVFTSEKSRQVFEKVLSDLPEDWDILLSGCYTMTVEKEYEGFVKLSDFRSLHSVVIRKSAYDKFLSHNHDFTNNIDDHLAKLIPKGKLNAYMCHPMVAIQKPGYSYQRKMEVNYKNYLVGKTILK